MATTPTTPTFGQTGQSVKDYQTSLNNQFAGQAGYVPLKVDGIFGAKTQAAANFKPTVAPTAPTAPSNVIKTSDLAPTTPIQLPSQTTAQVGQGGTQNNTQTAQPSPFVASNFADQYLQQIQSQDTPAQSASTELSKSILSLLPNLEGQSQALIDAQNQAGLPALRTELQSINSQILKKQAEINQDDVKLVASMRAEETRDTLLPFAQNAQAKLAGDAAIMRGLKTAEIGVLNAQALAKQGEIQLAQDTVKEAVDARFAPYKERIATYQSQLEALQPILTRDEKKQALAQQFAVEQYKQGIQDVSSFKKESITKLFDLAKDGKINMNSALTAISGLIDGTKSPSEVFATLGITGSGNPGIVGGYNISKYATDPDHEIKVASIYNRIGGVSGAQGFDAIIKGQYPNSPITGSMIMNAANQFNVDPKMIFAIMAQDSSLSTAGVAKRTNNPGNAKWAGQANATDSGIVAGDGGTYARFNTLQDGVNYTAKWLSKNKATGIYNGEFGATLESAVSGEPVKLQESTLKTLQNKIASKDYASAYQLMGNSVSKALTGENKTRYDSARIDVNILSNLQNVLKQYEDAGGDMNFLKGTTEQIQRKFGALKKDPKFASIAVQLEREFQAYRNQMTGAAFSPGESREYESVNPTGKKSFALNYAVINGAVNQLNNRIDSTVQSIAGDGAKTIKDFAKYQGLKPDDIVLKLGQDKPEFYGTIDQMIKQGIQSDVILEVLGYAPLLK